MPFFNLTRLNRMCADSQWVAFCENGQKMEKCHLCLAKKAVFSCFFAFFDVIFHPMQRGGRANAAWLVGQRSTLRWKTLHASSADAARFGGFFSTFGSVKKKAKSGKQ